MIPQIEGSPAPVASSSALPPAIVQTKPSSSIVTQHPFASTSNPPTIVQKCTRCTYSGSIDTFPPRRNGAGQLKVCGTCMEKQAAKKAAMEASGENASRGQVATAAMNLDDFLKLVTFNKGRPFDFDTMVSLPSGMFAADEHLYNRTNRVRDFLAEASDYHWNQKKTKRGGKSTVVTYFCAQLEGEQSKSRTQDADRKSRSRLIRYHCGGWLRITIMDDNELLVRIRMTHVEAHPSFPSSLRRPNSEIKYEPPLKPLPPQSLFTSIPPIGAPMVPSPLIIAQEDEETRSDAGDHSEVAAPKHDGHSADSNDHDAKTTAFSHQQLAQLKRNFDAMMVTASGPMDPELAHALGSVFHQIDRTVEDIEAGRFAKKARNS
ncbi:hypothetical protein BJ138DRAFT_1147232 [Hygrophoropsis aurantiaca]|uniref:Uncharacterized protein n=1 Tax=Hygrophoropsis aurantiaca TaxID=72124 RepID=A0ACB8AHF1_9AGAM|nr:hypothetical protein BJ138DRAFT_1147232 [Hygrophoropsis aurantiaca]